MSGLNPGDEIVAVGWAGLDGSVVIAGEKTERLSQSLPESMIKRVSEDFSEKIDLSLCKNIADRVGVTAVYEMGKGGVFGALWEFGTAYDVGFEVDLKKIPIRQETIEICEVFDINPYLLRSEGALLMATPKGAVLVDRLAEAGIYATVIGYVSEKAGRVVKNGDGKRFLEPRHPDELDKVKQM